MSAGGEQGTFVLVHGAFHGGWCWREVGDLLTARGHKVFRPSLTGLGDRKHLLDARVDLSTHVADIVNLTEVEDLQDVVLVGHSYAGFVITVQEIGSPNASARWFMSTPSFRTMAWR